MSNQSRTKRRDDETHSPPPPRKLSRKYCSWRRRSRQLYSHDYRAGSSIVSAGGNIKTAAKSKSAGGNIKTAAKSKSAGLRKKPRASGSPPNVCSTVPINLNHEQFLFENTFMLHHPRGSPEASNWTPSPTTLLFQLVPTLQEFGIWSVNRPLVHFIRAYIKRKNEIMKSHQGRMDRDFVLTLVRDVNLDENDWVKGSEIARYVIEIAQFVPCLRIVLDNIRSIRRRSPLIFTDLELTLINLPIRMVRTRSATGISQQQREIHFNFIDGISASDAQMERTCTKMLTTYNLNPASCTLLPNVPNSGQFVFVLDAVKNVADFDDLEAMV